LWQKGKLSGKSETSRPRGFPVFSPFKNDRLTQKRKKCAEPAAEIVFLLKFSAPLS
jgi:hypothetical protein